MKYLFKNTVVGFLLMSSLTAFGGSNAPGVFDDQDDVNAGMSPSKPAASNDQPAKQVGDLTTALGNAGTSSKTASPPGGGHYNAEDITGPVKKWGEVIKPMECEYQAANAMKIYSEIQTASKKYEERQTECDKREDNTNSVCMESRSAGIKDFISVAQVLMAGVSGMMEACSAFGKVMDMGNKALTLYRTACSTARGYCNAACGEAVESVKKIGTKREKLLAEVLQEVKKVAAESPKEAAACNAYADKVRRQLSIGKEAIDLELKADGKDYQTMAQKNATCKGYETELATAGLGALAMIKSFGTANKCEKNTTSSPTVATTAGTVDCTIAANKQNNMECICKDAPRTPGCNNGLDTATVAKSADSLRAASGTGEYKPGAAGGAGGIDGGSDLPDMAKKADGGGGSSPGAPVGGGGGGLGGSSGGFGGGPGGGAAQKGSGLNTNILAGEGGGGGGGSWGGFGGSDKDGLRQYLPGGKRDPSGAMAGAAVSKEVTSQGGKSNWEKVRDRYRDNKPSLLGY